MPIKVTIDKIGRLTKFIDAETGEDIGQKLAISASPEPVIRIGPFVTMEATLCLLVGQVSVDRAVWKTKHPITGRYEDVAAFEFRDGTRVDFDDNGKPILCRHVTPKPPAGYTLLQPPGTVCKCPHLWQDAAGNHYCCGGR